MSTIKPSRVPHVMPDTTVPHKLGTAAFEKHVLAHKESHCRARCSLMLDFLQLAQEQLSARHSGVSLSGSLSFVVLSRVALGHPQKHSCFDKTKNLHVPVVTVCSTIAGVGLSHASLLAYTCEAMWPIHFTSMTAANVQWGIITVRAVIAQMMCVSKVLHV